MIHTSVLLQEAIDGLHIVPSDIFVDATVGNGGHLEEVCKRFGNTVTMIGIDLDSDAIARSRERLGHYGSSIIFLQGNFRSIDEILQTHGISAVDRILLDVGLSSNQFEESGRGFSFQKNEPLLMSFRKTAEPNNSESNLTAQEILNTWDEENIRAILEGYGEEKFAYKIAQAIVSRRKEKPIENTFDLVDIIKSVTPAFYHHRKIHPATKTFQALRITVNNEIENLREGMRKSFDILKTNGRLAVISFHSLEDRLVKQYFKELEEGAKGRRVNKKPIIPTDEELKKNPRSRSAKLRIIEKNL